MARLTRDGSSSAAARAWPAGRSRASRSSSTRSATSGAVRELADDAIALLPGLTAAQLRTSAPRPMLPGDVGRADGAGPARARRDRARAAPAPRCSTACIGPGAAAVAALPRRAGRQALPPGLPARAARALPVGRAGGQRDQRDVPGHRPRRRGDRRAAARHRQARGLLRAGRRRRSTSPTPGACRARSRSATTACGARSSRSTASRPRSPRRSCTSSSATTARSSTAARCVPCTREATLVHFVDNLGGRLGSFDRLERELPEGAEWSAADRVLRGGAYFGRQRRPRRGPRRLSDGRAARGPARAGRRGAPGRHPPAHRRPRRAALLAHARARAAGLRARVARPGARAVAPTGRWRSSRRSRPRAARSSAWAWSRTLDRGRRRGRARLLGRPRGARARRRHRDPPRADALGVRRRRRPARDAHHRRRATSPRRAWPSTPATPARASCARCIRRATAASTPACGRACRAIPSPRLVRRGRRRAVEERAHLGRGGADARGVVGALLVGQRAVVALEERRRSRR